MNFIERTGQNKKPEGSCIGLCCVLEDLKDNLPSG